MRVFVGMETSGATRRAIRVLGHQVISCDVLAPDDDCVTFPVSEIEQTRDLLQAHWMHLQGDVFAALAKLASIGWVPDFALFHPTCTNHTVSAAWAFNDPDYNKYPGVGYHQKVKAETLTGAARRAARERDEHDLERIRLLPFYKMVENPKGTIPTRTRYGKPCDIVQPYEFGHDASKATCLWLFDHKGNKVPFTIKRAPELYVPPTLRTNGLSYWANQTDTGQNRLSPGANRWKERSATFPGISKAIADFIHYGA